ncbi:hypothetical protein CAP35_15035 [Chitinophagaceae bacterium IBVUCB1]|nr:hypothetical protein CAP35_15035 [Chitinophagaceae bacterium IBVUCB1]
MTTLSKYITILLLSVFYIGVCGAQIKEYQQLNTDNGFPTNNVYSCLQDKYGYIWYATDNGVVRMNGYNIRIFTKNDGLPTNDIWKLYEDSKGRVWILFHGNEIGYISNNKYHSIKYESNMVSSPYFIRDINGTVFFLFRVGWKYHAMLVNIDERVSSFIKLPDSIQYLNLTPDNRIFYSSKINTNIKELLPVINKDRTRKYCSSDFVSFMASGPHFTNGMYAYGYVMGGSNLLTCNLLNCKVDTIHTDKLVNKTGGKIYITNSVNDTVYVYTRDKVLTFSNQFQLINSYVVPDYICKYTQVSWMHKDDIGRSIFTTKHNGAYVLPKNCLKLDRPLFSGQSEQYTFLLYGRNGRTYWQNGKTNQLIVLDSNYNIINRKNETNKINALASYKPGHLIYNIGSEFTIMNDRLFTTKKYYDNKVVFIEGLNKRNYTYAVQKMVTQTKAQMKDEYKDRNLNGLLNMFYDTLASVLLLNAPEYAGKVVENADSLTFYNDDYERFNRLYYFPSLNVYFHYNDKHISIRYGAYGKYVRLPDYFLSMIGGQSIVSIFSDSKYNVYIHTNHKLFVFSFRTLAFREIRMPFNISNAAIKWHKDYLIVAGKQGIAFAKVDADKLTLSGFRFISQGTQSVFNSISDFFVDSTSGTVLLNTDKGVYTTHADSIINSSSYYLLEDSRFMRLNTSFPKTRTILQQDTLFLGKDDNTLKFDFVNFYGKGERKYRYRITENSKWTESTTGEVFLPNIKPEKYYKMQCVATDDWWNSGIYTFYIYKEPYWWQSSKYVRIFWIAGFVLLGLLIFGIVLITRYYVNRTNERKNRLLDLELRAVYSQINPHFIFNTLSSALFFINKKNFEEAYTHVSKFSKLLRSYLNSSQERYVTLSHEISMLRNYIELQQIRFEEKFAYDITVDNKIPADNIKIPSLLLQPLVENAINHGLFHLKRKGELHISFMQGKNNNELICTIDDDGVGRERAAEIKEASTAQHTSYGTKLTRKLIDIFEEYENMNIHLEYIDKKAPQTGTIVKLTIRNLKYDA